MLGNTAVDQQANIASANNNCMDNIWASQVGTSSKEPTCQCRRLKRQGFDPWVGKISWRWAQQPTPVFLSGESRGKRSLMGYSPQGHKESNTTEVTVRTHTHVHICMGYIYERFHPETTKLTKLENPKRHKYSKTMAKNIHYKLQLISVSYN